MPVGFVPGLVDLPGISSRDLVSEDLAIRGVAGMLNLARRIPKPGADQRPIAMQEDGLYADRQSGERGFPIHGQGDEKPRVGHNLRPALHPSQDAS